MVYWIGDLTKRVMSDTPLCAADPRQDKAAVIATQERRRLPLIERTDLEWAHQSPGTN